MGDTKPLGSEKLNSDEKFKRILELTYYNSSNKNTKSTKSELVKESTSGTVYGIVKEKDGYYVKKGINESSLDYIGGMFMKNKNRFPSYAEALKRLELLKGQEQINEATKYVLKQKSKQDEAPVASEPSMDDLPPAPGGEEMPAEPSGGEQTEPTLPPTPGGEESSEPSMDSDMEPSSDEMGEKRSDYMAEIQKYAGKLGQELRDQKDRMESDDIKYVLNMVISAVDLDKLELEDLEEIGEKFERDEEESSMDSEEPSMDSEEPSYEEEPSVEDEPKMNDDSKGEFNEYDDPLKKLESFESWNVDEIGEDEVVELDLDEIKSNVNKSVSDILNKYFNKM